MGLTGLSSEGGGALPLVQKPVKSLASFKRVCEISKLLAEGSASDYVFVRPPLASVIN